MPTIPLLDTSNLISVQAAHENMAADDELNALMALSEASCDTADFHEVVSYVSDVMLFEVGMDDATELLNAIAATAQDPKARELLRSEYRENYEHLEASGIMPEHRLRLYERRLIYAFQVEHGHAAALSVLSEVIQRHHNILVRAARAA